MSSAVGLLMALAVAVCCAERGASVSTLDVYRLLEQLDIPYPADRLRLAAVEGMLGAVDPEARILNREDAGRRAARPDVAAAGICPEGVRYLKLNGLDGTGSNVVARLSAWAQPGGAGLVFDLRDAGGDSLEAVDRVAEVFTGGDVPLYSVRNGHGLLTESRRSEAQRLWSSDWPVIVLMNRGTRGAGRLLCALLKEQPGILLLGHPSDPDPRIREWIALDDDHMLYLGTRWITPGTGEVSTAQSILPHVPFNAEPDRAPSGSAETETCPARPEADDPDWRRGDPMLGRAIDILLGLQALAPLDPLPPPVAPAPQGPEAAEKGTSSMDDEP